MSHTRKRGSKAKVTYFNFRNGVLRIRTTDFKSRTEAKEHTDILIQNYDTIKYEFFVDFKGSLAVVIASYLIFPKKNW